MIHTLAETYGINPREAEKLTELDYFICVGNKNLQSERESYIMKNNQND